MKSSKSWSTAAASVHQWRNRDWSWEEICRQRTKQNKNLLDNCSQPATRRLKKPRNYKLETDLLQLPIILPKSRMKIAEWNSFVFFFLLPKKREEFITPPEIDRSGAAIVEFDRALLLFSGQIRSAMFDGTTNRLWICVYVRYGESARRELFFFIHNHDRSSIMLPRDAACTIDNLSSLSDSAQVERKKTARSGWPINICI